MRLALLGLVLSLSACTTYSDVREIKLLGFTEDLHRGTSSQSVSADDCTYYLFGNALGSQPDISQAIANARTGKTARIQDTVTGSAEETKSFRYVNRISTNYSGFSIGFFRKSCIEVKGVGYL